MPQVSISQVVEVVVHIVLQLLQQVELVVAAVVLQRHLDLTTLVEVDLPLIHLQVLVVQVVPVSFSSHILPN
tara:strand:+ start:638 stop:853 length:216 start_codon:yes stop_codon:yes gene_type:complete